jgi:ligand-binding SRPBCC domain-containing protein
MATFSLKTVQNIPVSLDTAWEFFSNPANLQAITPQNMGFQILSHHHGSKMYAGQIIEYKVKPVLGIPIYWMTEITHVEDRKHFIDEQRFGPYQLWHHQHHFKEIEGGVEMTDIVHYRNPLGVLGNIANTLLVKKQLQQIFEFRIQKVEELFGKWVPQQPMKVEFFKAS